MFSEHPNVHLIPTFLLWPAHSSPFTPVPRLERRKGTARKVAVYRTKAESRLMLQMAAKSWANGVPWDEALRIAKQVSSRVDKIQKKRLGKGS